MSEDFAHIPSLVRQSADRIPDLNRYPVLSTVAYHLHDNFTHNRPPSYGVIELALNLSSRDSGSQLSDIFSEQQPTLFDDLVRSIEYGINFFPSNTYGPSRYSGEINVTTKRYQTQSVLLSKIFSHPKNRDLISTFIQSGCWQEQVFIRLFDRFEDPARIASDLGQNVQTVRNLYALFKSWIGGNSRERRDAEEQIRQYAEGVKNQDRDKI